MHSCYLFPVHLLQISNLEALTEIDHQAIYAPDLLLKLWWLWVIAAAYVYRWKYLIEKIK